MTSYKKKQGKALQFSQELLEIRTSLYKQFQQHGLNKTEIGNNPRWKDVSTILRTDLGASLRGVNINRQSAQAKRNNNKRHFDYICDIELHNKTWATPLLKVIQYEMRQLCAYTTTKIDIYDNKRMLFLESQKNEPVEEKHLKKLYNMKDLKPCSNCYGKMHYESRVKQIKCIAHKDCWFSWKCAKHPMINKQMCAIAFFEYYNTNMSAPNPSSNIDKQKFYQIDIEKESAILYSSKNDDFTELDWNDLSKQQMKALVKQMHSNAETKAKQHSILCGTAQLNVDASNYLRSDQYEPEYWRFDEEFPEFSGNYVTFPSIERIFFQNQYEQFSGLTKIGNTTTSVFIAWWWGIMSQFLVWLIANKPNCSNLEISDNYSSIKLHWPVGYAKKTKTFFPGDLKRSDMPPAWFIFMDVISAQVVEECNLVQQKYDQQTLIWYSGKNWTKRTLKDMNGKIMWKGHNGPAIGIPYHEDTKDAKKTLLSWNASDIMSLILYREKTKETEIVVEKPPFSMNQQTGFASRGMVHSPLIMEEKDHPQVVCRSLTTKFVNDNRKELLRLGADVE
eukprot:101945_1